MGNCARTEPKFDPTLAKNLSDFSLKHPIGRGGFGRVWKVQQKQTKAKFAMKVMSKGIIVSKNSVASIMNERRLLGILKHPFIVNLQYAFQDASSVYLVVDLMQGGDLRYHLLNHPSLSENSLKFMSACILTAFEYLHGNSIIHRDIKPENLIFDLNGYLHITDFGTARLANNENAGMNSGTPGYMAPEVICGQDHGCEADYFALGVILYECIMGVRPYLGKNRKEVRENILAKQIQLKTGEDSKWSPEFIQLVNGLLQRKPNKRIGSRGVADVKAHKAFEGFDWKALYKKEMKSPFRFEKKNNFDRDHVMAEWDTGSQKLSRLNSQKYFAGFLYDSTLVNLQSNNK